MPFYSSVPYQPSFRLSDGNQMNGEEGLTRYTTDSAIVALGSTQADAYQLIGTVNRLTTVGGGTGVRLPPPVPGRMIVVFNAGANPVRVYGFGLDTVDGAAGATGVPLANTLRCIYWCIAPGVWISSQLGAVSA